MAPKLVLFMNLWTPALTPSLFLESVDNRGFISWARIELLIPALHLASLTHAAPEDNEFKETILWGRKHGVKSAAWFGYTEVYSGDYFWQGGWKNWAFGPEHDIKF